MYIPRRDDRFEYLYEAMMYLEETQCKTCKLRKTLVDPDEEFPMCYKIEGGFLLEEPIAEIDDVGDEGLVCTLRESE